MKRKINILLTMALGAALCTSCMDSYETLPADEFTWDYLFSPTDSAGTQSRQLLNSIYAVMESGHNRVGGDYLDASTDDAISSYADTDPDVTRIFKGSYTASNRVSSDMQWDNYYAGIRKVNILLGGIDRVPFRLTYVNAKGETRPLGVSMKAEARFLRAWFYFQLMRRYGGVPIVGDKVFGLNDDLQLPRNTFKECVDYVVGELDAIQDSLRPMPIVNPSEYAHVASKQVCQALKSRVLLYAASPLFNGKTLEQGNELVGYKDYDPERWKLAADAARDIIESVGHKGSEDIILTEDVRDVFLNFYSYGANPELIFFRQNGKGTSIESANGPLGFTGTNLGHGHTCPTQNLVDAFPMLDGRPITDTSADRTYKYDEQNPYANRDPRLDKTILHNGSKWLGTTLATWQGGDNNPSNVSTYSKTSYYMCKFMGKFADATSYSEHTYLWVMFRYAEILLNFAEAENEYLDAPSKEVYDAIRLLRQRAGIKAGKAGCRYGLPDGMTKEEMRKVIQNERRIELAFEEHRFYDIRRWRIAEEAFAKPLQGMNITVGSGQTVYTRVDLMSTNFSPKYYLYPIPYSEVNKNENMKQNPNW